ncbi:MAG: hypothetical protein JEZ11_20905 [Desulfobacterales bacterium]|nr:hypothetical protein [Desulfobacterales bacterium]
MRNLIMTTLLILFSISGLAPAAANDIFEIETEGRYRMAAGSSVDLAKKVALFTAKRKAIELAGRYLSHDSLIKIYDLDKEEIYSLAAKETQAEILMEKWETVEKITTYRIRVRVQAQTSDFIKAEMADAALERKESKESYQEEMEPHISVEIDPGGDIAKAYRLIRKKKWRMATIYLNHLEKKYPDWEKIYMAQAIIN